MALGYLVILGKELLSPLVFSVLFSILLLPLANYLEKRWNFHRGLASLFATLIFVACIVIVAYFIINQLGKLAADWPMFQEHLETSLYSLQNWISKKYHVNSQKQLTYVTTALDNLISSSTTIISTTFLSVSSIMLFLVFTIIDTFLLLVYRRLIFQFLVSIFTEKNEQVVQSILMQTQNILRKYIIGLFFEMLIVAVMNCVAFVVIGVPYPILLGVLAAIFNLVPYVGIFTALLLTILISFASAASTSTLFLGALALLVVHLIDSNILLPLIVGSRVKINALVALLGVIMGEMLWGISGMFLSIPVIAVTKIICDRIDILQPWGLLLGEESKTDVTIVVERDRVMK